MKTNLTKTEKIVLDGIIHINKTTLGPASFDDFKDCREIYGIKHGAMTSSNYKKYINSLLKKHQIITSSRRSRPQSYYAMEYRYLGQTVTNNRLCIQKEEENSNYLGPRDVSDILSCGVHNILFCPRIKYSHQALLKYGLEENTKKMIKVGTFVFNNIKFSLRSTSQDTLMINVKNSRNQIILNSINHLKQFDNALDELIDMLYTKYKISGISHHDDWIIKQWHYALDKNVACGEKFHVTYKDAKHIFHRIYSKEFEFTNTRTEVQTQPNLAKMLVMPKTHEFKKG